ncbi:hypothetical protein ACP70R_009429 [Stipagrostis hirtigluma subsp. patula]
MAGKRGAAGVAVCCLLVVVVLLSWQPEQAAALSKFCRCYQQCYAKCRKDRGRYPCDFGCFQDCINGGGYPPATPTSAAGCSAFCLDKFCGVSIAPTEADACVDGCIKSLGAQAPSTATIN